MSGKEKNRQPQGRKDSKKLQITTTPGLQNHVPPQNLNGQFKQPPKIETKEKQPTQDLKAVLLQLLDDKQIIEKITKNQHHSFPQQFSGHFQKIDDESHFESGELGQELEKMKPYQQIMDRSNYFSQYDQSSIQQQIEELKSLFQTKLDQANSLMQQDQQSLKQQFEQFKSIFQAKLDQPNQSKKEDQQRVQQQSKEQKSSFQMKLDQPNQSNQEDQQRVQAQIEELRSLSQENMKQQKLEQSEQIKKLEENLQDLKNKISDVENKLIESKSIVLKANELEELILAQKEIIKVYKQEKVIINDIKKQIQDILDDVKQQKYNFQLLDDQVKKRLEKIPKPMIKITTDSQQGIDNADQQVNQQVNHEQLIQHQFQQLQGHTRVYSQQPQQQSINTQYGNQLFQQNSSYGNRCQSSIQMNTQNNNVVRQITPVIVPTQMQINLPPNQACEQPNEHSYG